tara:strand:- start:7376 stop:8164 length:789 start_codon:yes stop_codon:yes gene_type:complete
MSLVSLCITSYNRYLKLSNCIESFLKTNVYEPNNLEVVIVDNGSTDEETINYINDLELPVREVKKVLNKVNKYPYCLRIAKNQAREIAAGDYFIDCPDDHLFVLKDDWINKTIDYFNKEKDKVSCSCHYAYPAYRFKKKNNLMKKSQINDDFYVSEFKGYSDYHFIPRNNYIDIGKYREDLGWEPNSEHEYQERAYSMGYRRALHKYPASIINGHTDADPVFKLVEPISEQEYKKNFSHLQRPCSLEEVVSHLKENSKVEQI